MRTALARTLPLVFCLAAGAAQAGGAAGSGAPASKANDIVGSWSVRVALGPCPGPGFNVVENGGGFLATLAFHAGGTLTETNSMPLSGAPGPLGIASRNGPGLGSWSYNPAADEYSAGFRFDWWVNNFYAGYQSIDRQEIWLSADGQTYYSRIQASTHRLENGAHTPVANVCGVSIGTRF